jgi:membrane protease subunit HflC
MTVKNTFSILIVLIVVMLLIASVFTVHEGQQALLLRFGKIITDSKTGSAKVYLSGLHVKMPFINEVQKFDVRLQTLDVQSSRILTAEQKYVLVDYYVKWKIENLPLYFTRTGGNNVTAENLLKQKINDALRAEFGMHKILEVISDDREKIMAVLRKNANISAENLGIAIADVRIKRIDLPEEVSQSVFARMRADREKVAAQHRADGKAQAEAIKAQADASATVIVATAKAQAAKIRAQGEREAANIYAHVYNKNAAFYSFYRSLNAYRNTFDTKQTVLVLKPNSQFFKYFKKSEL